MEELMSAVVSAVIGAVAGAVVTALVSFLLARRKEKVEKRERAKEKARADYDARPRFEVVSEDDLPRAEKEKAVLEFVILDLKGITQNENGEPFCHYDQKALDEKNLRCVEFKLKNIGHTEIDSVCAVSTNYKVFSIFDLHECGSLIQRGYMNLDVYKNRCFIGSGQLLSVRVFFLADETPELPINLFLFDTHRLLWQQELSLVEKKTGNSIRTNQELFEASRDVAYIMDCYRKHK